MLRKLLSFALFSRLRSASVSRRSPVIGLAISGMLGAVMVVPIATAAHASITAGPNDVFIMPWEGALYKVDSTTGQTTGPLSEVAPFNGPPGFEIDSSKNLGYFVSYDEPSRIYVLNLSTGLFDTSSIELPARYCRGVDLQADGTLWVACDASNSGSYVIVRVDLDTKTAEQVGGSGQFRPTGLATDPLTGELFVHGDTGQAATVDQITGNWTLISEIRPDENCCGSVDYFSDGRRVIWAYGANQLFVQDRSSGIFSSIQVTGNGLDGEGMAVAGDTLGTYIPTQNFTLTYNYNSATDGNSEATGTFTTGGSPITLPTPTRNGYTFSGWYSDEGFVSKIGDGGSTFAPSGPTLLLSAYAKWTANTYAVTYNSNGGTSVAAGSFTTGGTLSSAPASPTRSGYTFGGWAATDGGSLLSFAYSPGVTHDITLYAKWTRNSVKAVATVKPKVSGKAISTAKGTNKVSAIAGTWTGYPTPAISYQWYACTTQVKTATATFPKTCKSISKATKATFAVTNSFKGQYLAVKVTGQSAGTSATQWLSVSTAKVK